ncbi:C40 family peptidase [Alicyclobacillus acidoterrestris]|uniref:C40 family peptidase n=1 Tax=Alicyclobacillus acidoterrestris (strain ATCC 49025 / DSM 3922 / CIP 106132 / NCIMB 13137 / GD3B) TaxID=1356854 RepID=T0CXZ5_ALIAG|nr:C40 family peptidase [Alicyclobacillus acidoterrestris]EPZ42391.1 hypothetical protein N007_15235 [Alicyclobacillus acidoterrestris ATCC 49025]UNO50516.1 C40 family peptidase [Alicyclobacillus acidoterrestris]
MLKRMLTGMAGTVACSFAVFTPLASASTALPPGVTMDKQIHPEAATTATTQQKENAVLNVAKSKMGTPYIWGHNEDRGQYGFDCSNFTSYVYHHALGYKMTTSSRAQYTTVGWHEARSAARPGDLVIFDKGHHVGIYAGNNEVLQEGGGLGKVGYISIKPGSYWSKHVSAVRKMF